MVSTFRDTADAVVARAIDSKAGFSLVLAGLKPFLEHRIELNLVAGHDPDSPVEKQFYHSADGCLSVRAMSGNDTVGGQHVILVGIGQRDKYRSRGRLPERRA